MKKSAPSGLGPSQLETLVFGVILLLAAGGLAAGCVRGLDWLWDRIPTGKVDF